MKKKKKKEYRIDFKATEVVEMEILAKKEERGGRLGKERREHVLKHNEPVRAMATTSFPSIISGMHLRGKESA